MQNTTFPIDRPVIALVGPTAIGKTEISLQLAERFNCEIISMDSMQVYRFMDIGTAKATVEERERIKHHLIDIVTPDQQYDAARFVTDALSAIKSIHATGKIPLITGGTGLYLRSLLEGLFEGGEDISGFDPQIRQQLTMEETSKLHEVLASVDCDCAHKIHHNDRQRLIRALEILYNTGKTWSEHIALQKKTGKDRFNKFITLGLTCDRKELYDRINSRTSEMIASGLKEEVEFLMASGYGRELGPMQAIGYRHMVQHIVDGLPFDEMTELLARDTRRYAKRQYTWFKKMNVDWIDKQEPDKVFRLSEKFISE